MGTLAPAVSPADNPVNYLREIRKDLEVSERKLARRSGYPRSTAQRMERNRSWRDLTNDEVARYAAGLGLAPAELVRLHGLREQGRDAVTRFSVKEPESVFPLDDGVRFSALAVLRRPVDQCVGQVEIGPQKTLASAQRPQGESVTWRVLEGCATLSIAGLGEIVLKKDQGIVIRRDIAYEIYNPHALQKAVLSLMTVPSFIRTGS